MNSVSSENAWPEHNLESRFKVVAGVWLPREEDHLDGFLLNSHRVDGLGVYQYDTTIKALSLVKNFRRAIDIGAHVGLMSMHYAKVFEHVESFEPTPAHAACFRLNVKAPNVTLHEMALGDFDGHVSINADPHNSGHAHINPEGNGTVNAEIGRLDDFEFEDVDFLKCDVEGFETAVMKGAVDTICRCKPIICLEQKSNHHIYGYDRYEAVDWLKGLNMVEVGRVRDDYIMGWR